MMEVLDVCRMVGGEVEGEVKGGGLTGRLISQRWVGCVMVWAKGVSGLGVLGICCVWINRNSKGPFGLLEITRTIFAMLLKL